MIWTTPLVARVARQRCCARIIAVWELTWDVWANNANSGGITGLHEYASVVNGEAEWLTTGGGCSSRVGNVGAVDNSALERLIQC